MSVRLSLLFDEYKILQDKIDKIGSFRVTIKGWAVTATVGALVAIASGKGFSPSASSCAIDVLLFFFFKFEREQVGLGWLFNNRARQIEVQFDRRRRAKGLKTLFSAPNIARSLFSSKRKRRDLITRSFSSPRLEKLRIHVNREARLARGSDLVFYFILGLAVWIPKWLGVVRSPSDLPISIHNVIQVPAQNRTPAARPPAEISVPAIQNGPKSSHKRREKAN